VGAVQSALGLGGCSDEVRVLATYFLQFAKPGSATTLPQQVKNNSEDLQRGSTNVVVFM
jgi:hypothetical protein